MCKHYYFFKPRVIEETYQQGFLGYRTLIVGASLPCYPEQYNCTIKDRCKHDTSLCDKKCPPYTNFEDKEYYCLSNSNEIEIQSYIEGSSHSHLFDRICRYMAGTCKTEEEKKTFWNQVAFTNYHQNIYVAPWNYPNLPPYVEDTDKNFKAFLEVLDELKPEIIYFCKDVKDIILKKCIVGLEEIKCLSTEKEIELCPFLYNISSKDEPKNIIQEFKKHFSSTDNLERTILHALFKARRYNSCNQDHDHEISNEMILFVEKHAWDIHLYKYLINQIEEELGLDIVINYIKEKVITNNMKIASAFAINDVDCDPIYNFSYNELSLFSFKRHKTLKEMGEYDLVLYYFDEYSKIEEIKKALFKTENSNQKRGIVIKRKNFSYADELLNSNRIREIHFINDAFIFVSIETIEPFCQIHIISETPKLNKLIPLEYLRTKETSKLDLNNFIYVDKLIQDNKKTLDELEYKGWIKKESGIYKITPKTLTIPYEKGTESKQNKLNCKLKIAKKTSIGAVYSWLKYKKIENKGIRIIFQIHEDLDIRRSMNEYNSKVKECVTPQETNEDKEKYKERIEKQQLLFLKRIFEEN